MIREANADIVFIGISIAQAREVDLRAPALLSGGDSHRVGAAFDFHAGRTKQAPAWMQRNGTEWLFRLRWNHGVCGSTSYYYSITPRFLPLWPIQR
jgi:N-acetylglucosaminyldiphosphoundecaprenol N-acetyl-beta-D-mannosaminyltransferase